MQPEPTPTWKKMLRRAAIVVAGLLVVLLLLLGWLLGTDSGHAKLRSLIVDQANGALNGTLEIAALEGGPLRAWRLAGVRILDDAGVEVLGAESMELRLGWNGGPAVVEARIVAPRMSLRHRPDGTLNLLSLRPERPAGLPLDERPPPPTLRVAKLLFERGAFRYEGEGGTPVVTLDDLAGELGFETAGGTTHLRVGWLSAILLGGPVARLTADLTLGSRLIDLAHAELRVGGSILEVKARYARPEGESSQLDVDILRAELGVPEVVRWMMGARLPSGVTLRGGVHGTAGDLRVKLEALAGVAGTATVEGKFSFIGRPSYELAVRGRAVDLNAWSFALPTTRLDLDAVLRGEGLAPLLADATWTIDASGDIGGLAAGALKLPLVLRVGTFSFEGASWPAAGIPSAAGEWTPGRLTLKTAEGTFATLVLRFLDVEKEVRWEWRIGAGAPERVLVWRPGVGWGI